MDDFGFWHDKYICTIYVNLSPFNPISSSNQVVFSSFLDSFKFGVFIMLRLIIYLIRANPIEIDIGNISLFQVG